MLKIIDYLTKSSWLPMISLVTIAFCLIPRAYATDTYEFIGKDANYDGPCNVQQCNNNSGCRVTAQIWDQWFPGYSCNGGENQGGSCDQNFRLCREIRHHGPEPNCSGDIEYREWINQALCSGGDPPKNPPPGGG